MIVGIKSGTFTILTKGHVECLKFCKSFCDHLIVVINNDEYLIEKKGFCVVPLEERMAVLESVKYVDRIISYPEPSEHQLVNRIKEEMSKVHDFSLTIFHALGTHKKDFIPGQGIADRIIFCPNTESSSTSDIMDRIIRNDCRN